MARRRKPGDDASAATAAPKRPAKAPAKGEVKKPKRAVLSYMREFYGHH